jgi:hypothetical protein
LAVHLIEPVSPSLEIPRAWPCAAIIDQLQAACGATPALLYRRVCLHGHARDLYLCRPHEQSASRTGSCGDCSGLRTGAHRCPVALVLLPEAVDLIRRNPWQ